jgi:hypothetical protein
VAGYCALRTSLSRYVVDGLDGPLYADMHALRHSYITLLSRSGAPLKVVQLLARHSDVRLTIGLYTHAEEADKAAAVQSLTCTKFDPACTRTCTDQHSRTPVYDGKSSDGKVAETQGNDDKQAGKDAT